MRSWSRQGMRRGTSMARCALRVVLGVRWCASTLPTTNPVTHSSSNYLQPSSHSNAANTLQAPPTEITGLCNILAECVTKSSELRQQMRLQDASADPNAHLISREGLNEFMEELKDTAREEVGALIQTMKQPSTLQAAPMSEIRRSLFYAGSLKKKDWISKTEYTTMMKLLSVEILRRDREGVLTADDTLYVSTHIIITDFYNKQLWDRMEQSLDKTSTFENIDMGTIKGLTTKLFRSRGQSKLESVDIRRKILAAMSRRVGDFTNEFDLPTLLGIIQCYTVHDIFPRWVEPLAIRAINHINDFTPQECTTLCLVFRKWRLIKMDVCERLIERITQAEIMTPQMASAALVTIKAAFTRISERNIGGAADAQKQKLRALGEQVACRLDEVRFPRLNGIMQCLDVVVTMKVYVPKKCLVNVFKYADEIFARVEASQNPHEETKSGHHSSKPITMEEARQLLTLLNHFGADLCPELKVRLQTGLREGLFPEEASQDSIFQ